MDQLTIGTALLLGGLLLWWQPPAMVYLLIALFGFSVMFLAGWRLGYSC